MPRPMQLSPWFPLIAALLVAAMPGVARAGEVLLSSTTYPFGQGIGADGIAAADFDGNGTMDLAAGNEFTAAASNNRLAIWSNDGNGVMTISALLPLASAPMDVVTADFNGDLLPDVAIANFVPGNSISFYLNDGQGGFLPRVDQDVNSIPTSLAAADLDGDGDVDVAFTLRSIVDHHVGVFLNDGAGGFAGPLTRYLIGVSPNDVAIGDLNEDGRPELVAIASNTPVVSVLTNLGNGSFAPAVSHSVGPSPSAVVVGDLNGDGHLDFVVSDGDSTLLSTFLGDGTGALTPVYSQICCQSGSAMGLGDMDGDQLPDLVMNLTTTTMTVMGNQGDGTFLPIGEVPKGQATRSVTMADLDQDGDLDFATSNDFPLGDPTITVVINGTPEAWTDLGGGTSGIAGPPTLAASGPLTRGALFSMSLEDAPPSALMLALVSFQSMPAPALGGTLFANPSNAEFALVSDSEGAFAASLIWPAGVAAGIELYFQFLVQDLSVPGQITLSNAVTAITP